MSWPLRGVLCLVIVTGDGLCVSPSCLDGFEDSAILSRSSAPDVDGIYWEASSLDLCASSVDVDDEDAFVEEKVCCECVCEGGLGTALHLADVVGCCAAPMTNG